jgi:hypothetical protein
MSSDDLIGILFSSLGFEIGTCLAIALDESN